VRGGSEGLEQLLAGQPRFAHTGTGTGALYRYQPPAAPAP
jgi:hypothetical protein